MYENPYHSLPAWQDSQHDKPVVTDSTGGAIYYFNRPQEAEAPIWVLTGEITCDEPHERKRFKRIEFHGSGSIYVRTFVDGRFVSEGMVVCTETASKERALALPRGIKGYSIQLELSGIFKLDLIEIGYDSFPRTS